MYRWRGQVKPRDEADYANEDMIFLRFDPFGDSRVKLYFRIKCIWKSSRP